MRWTRTTTDEGHKAEVAFNLGKASHVLGVKQNQKGEWQTVIDGTFVAKCPATLKTHRSRRQFAVNLLRLRCQQYVNLKEDLDSNLAELLK